MEDNRNQQGTDQNQTSQSQSSDANQASGQQQNTGNEQQEQNPQEGVQWNNYRTREMSGGSSQGNEQSGQ